MTGHVGGLQLIQDKALAVFLCHRLHATLGKSVMYHNILVPVVFDNEHVPSYAISYIPQELQDELRVGIRQELDKLAKRMPGAEGHVIEGHSGRTIVEYAKEHRNDLIIIASHRPGLEDYFLGSTASHVVRHASCAVHVVR